MQVRGGRGVDRVLTHVVATGAVNSTVRTGGASDVIRSDYVLGRFRVDSPEISTTIDETSPSNIHVFAGRGDDRVTLRIAGPEGSDAIDEIQTSLDRDSGPVTAEVFGGIGDDVLTLLAEDVTGSFLVDGGRGHDRYLASDNVVVRNCEEPINKSKTLSELLMLLEPDG